MSGFGNIGTGLAGFMQGFQNSQQQAAQRALQQQALQQIQRALAGDRLLANTIFGGGIGNPTPQPPAPGQASVPTFPQGGGGAPSSAPPAPAAAAPQLPPMVTDPGQAQVGMVGDTDVMNNAGATGQEIPLEGPDAPQGPAPAPEPASAAAAPAATTTPTPSGSAGSGGGGTEQASAAGGSLANSSLFQQLLDPNHAYRALGEMRDRIAASAPPGTDPAVIWEATQQLYKLTNGGATERAQLAAYLKMAGLDVKQSEGAANRGSREDIAAANRGSREGIAEASRGSREKIVDTQITGREKLQGNAIAAGERKQQRQFSQQDMMEDRKQKAINERQDKRLAQSLEIANRKAAASPNNPELKRYTAQLNAIKAERDGILAKSRVKTPGGFFSGGGTLGLSDEEKKKVDELNQQIEGIAKQIAGSK